MSTQTKTRGPQAKPTKFEVCAAWGRLRSAAENGDVQASALLIALVEKRPVFMAADGLRA